jgi:hypothetical protein
MCKEVNVIQLEVLCQYLHVETAEIHASLISRVSLLAKIRANYSR